MATAVQESVVSALPQKPHTHECATYGCEKPAECYGTWERNIDGWPESICSDYHLPYGLTAEIYCPDCAARVPEEDDDV